MSHARAAGGAAHTFKLQGGEAFADPHTPPESFYELSGESSLSSLTAIRVEVPPLNADVARHTPEDGFIVDRVEAYVIPPGGHKNRIALRYILQDSEENMEASVLPAKEGSTKTSEREAGVADGFSAMRRLFRTRWIVAVPEKPQQLAPKSRIEVDLKQTRGIDSKPALIQRVRLAVSDDPRWTALAGDPIRAQNIARLKQLEELLAKIPSVQLPVMV